MNSQILTSLTPEELGALVKGVILEALNPILQASSTPNQPEDHYYTRKEAASRLKISLTTLWDRTRSGELRSHKIGGRILYRAADVEKSLVPRKFR